MPDSISSWGDRMAPADSTTRSPYTREGFAAADRLHAHGPASLEQHLLHIDLASHRQVQSVAHRGEMGQCRAHPHAAQVVGGRHAHAGRVGPVGVLHRRIAVLPASVIEGPLDGRRLGGLAAAHRYRAVGAVEVVLDVHIPLHLAVERQHLVVRPLGVALGRPGVKVLGQAPLHGLAVDGRPAADDLALGHVNLPPAPR